MLAAAVSGHLFASPSAKAVLAAIRAVAGKAGCLLIVTNYTGRSAFATRTRLTVSHVACILSSMLAVASAVKICINCDIINHERVGLLTGFCDCCPAVFLTSL